MVLLSPPSFWGRKEFEKGETEMSVSACVLVRRIPAGRHTPMSSLPVFHLPRKPTPPIAPGPKRPPPLPLLVSLQDGVFTMVTHRDPRLLDIVDDQWRKDKLPKDEIAIPAEHDFPTDDGDSTPPPPFWSTNPIPQRACRRRLSYSFLPGHLSLSPGVHVHVTEKHAGHHRRDATGWHSPWSGACVRVRVCGGG